MAPRKKQDWPNLSSGEITEVLRGQHTKDVFVSECKDGPSWGGGGARMDVWVMRKSWAHPCITAYEIKVSRNDFKQDNKWHAYLSLCNQLYFICPKGMIQPEEIPDGVGLKYCTQGRATVVRKAAHREIVPPPELFYYILMCRSKIVAPHFYEPETKEHRIERYKKWAAEKEENRRLGDILRYEISHTIDRTRANNDDLRHQIERYKKVEGFIKEVGISNWDSDDRIKDKLAQFKKLIPDEYVRKIQNIEDASKSLVSLLQNHRNQEDVNHDHNRTKISADSMDGSA